ncbi:MAG TPA: hypothetical protein VIS07_12375 [Candidatus Binatia bacterium]
MVTRRLPGATLAALIVSLATAAHAQTGATLTPNERNFMVNKDVGPERWTINVNLSSTSADSIVNVTGNIFRADGGPPSFVLCQVRPDSTGSLNDPGSEFRLTCQGADACQTSASECARDSWSLINGDVRIPASFFLPPGGLGAPASASASDASDAASQAAASTTSSDSLAERLQSALARAWSTVRVWLAGGSELATPRSAHAQSGNRGATLSLDRLNFLVNKDVGNERWSISLNFVPQTTEQGGVTPVLESVTGNVYQPDGSPPSFIFCTPRGDSTGTLDVPSSEFRFSCRGTSPCTSTARECARTQWVPLGDDIRLSASFFLPPGGLPASVQSDPEIVIIGRTSDPPSIVTGDFTTGEGAAGERPAGGCPTGATCFVPRLGSCQNVRGRVVELEGFGCGCFVEQVSAGCIGCGSGSSGQCGGSCEFPVGGATARGTCLPFAPDSSDCACYAIDARESSPLQSCGGPQGVGCPGDRCCTDDPRDGCDPLRGGAGCFGICVPADGCDPSRQKCGMCLAPQGQFCGNGRREGSEDCDGADFGGQSCDSFGFSGGRLRCTSTCGIDTSECAHGGNEPPRILDIDFPPVIDPHGGPVLGTVHFEDPDGDVIRARFQPIVGNVEPFTFDPGVFGRASGSFDFFVNCNGSVDEYVVEVTLEDQQGNLSEPEILQWSCASVAECGNGIVEEGEACDPPGQSSSCGSFSLCTNDCSQCVSATSCKGRCCPGRDDFCTPPDAACYCDEFCRNAQDCCDDVLEACGF